MIFFSKFDNKKIFIIILIISLLLIIAVSNTNILPEYFMNDFSKNSVYHTLYHDNFESINKKYYLSIGCIFKNESMGLYEFIEHNFYHGVDHIYLINDFSTDNFMDILEPYINDGKITLFNNDIVTTDTGRQSLIYNKYFKDILPETEWLAIIDIDEYLFSPNDIDIKNIIKKYDNNYNNITVEWINYGSNQCNYQPFSIVSGFNKHANLGDKDYYSYKSIMKTDFIKNFGIHSSELDSGNSINLSYTTGKNELFINHYQLQSKEFFINIKGTRGDVNNHYDSIGLKRNLDKFMESNLKGNEIECNTLIEQNREIIKKVKNYKLEQLKNDKSVTVVITSCDRPGLLEKTLDSFMKYNTYLIKEYIIIDDSGKIGINDFLLDKYSTKNINLLYNKKNMGQVKSIDKAYEYVTTKYIFHCEEDWEFLKPSFIELSFDILANDPKIYTVWLRPHSDTSNHPIELAQKFKNYYNMKKDFTYHDRGIEYIWSGVTFNPGLRRTSDMLLYHPYSINIEKDDQLGEVGEYVINNKYRLDGFYGVITDEPDGYVTHLGYGSHVKRSYE